MVDVLQVLLLVLVADKVHQRQKPTHTTKLTQPSLLFLAENKWINILRGTTLVLTTGGSGMYR